MPPSLRTIITGLAARLVIGKADIGRELAGDFVADTQPGIEFRQPRADAAGLVALVVKVQLELGWAIRRWMIRMS
jgi:hypothetical protein